MSQLTLLLLTQATYAIRNAGRLHTELMDQYGAGPPVESHADAQLCLFHASALCERQLRLTFYVARLCLSPGYQQLHRLQRYLSMAETCALAIEALVDAASSPGCVTTGDCRSLRGILADAVGALQNSSKCIAVYLESIGGSELATSSAHLAIEASQQESKLELKAPEPRKINKAEYLDCHWVYGWDRDVDLFWRYVYPENEAAVLLEPVNFTFQRMKTGKVPTWLGVKVGEDRRHLLADSVNAIWQSLHEGQLLVSLTKGAHQRRYAALANACFDYCADDPEMACHPFGLAEVLAKEQIGLGIVFQDDRSVVVWPKGKKFTDQSRRIIVLCGKILWAWRYHSIRIRANRDSITERIEPQDVSVGSSKRSVPIADSKSNEAKDVSGKKGLGDSKPAPFFRILPAELRNEIYELHVREDDNAMDLGGVTGRLELDCWRSIGIRSVDIIPPPLAAVNRQLWSEVLPLYLRSRTVSVYTGKCNTRGPWWVDFVPRNFTQVNRWMSVMPDTAHIRHLAFNVFETDRCIFLDLLSDAPFMDLRVTQDSDSQVLDPSMDELCDLVEVVLQDRRTAGLSMFDVAVIVDFAEHMRAS